MNEHVETFHGIMFSISVTKTGQLFYKLREKTEKRKTLCLRLFFITN